MKKIYLFALAALFSTASNAQAPVRLSSPLINGKSNVKVNATNSTRVVEGGIKCITQYVADTTMNLDFVIQLTNTDNQFGDSVAITFPAGITPNISANNTTVLAPDSTTGCPYVKLNGVFGQVISWGDNNDSCGGVTSAKDPFKFTVNVTVAPGLKGPQKTKFFISGDYVQKPKDLSDSLNILPTDTTLIDLETVSIKFDTKGSCGNTLVPIIGNFMNNGTVPVSKIPVAYSIENKSFVYDTIAGPIAPGQFIAYKFSKLADFTDVASYFVQVIVETKGDSVPKNNGKDFTFVNTAPFYSLLNGPYVNGFNFANDFDPIMLYYGSVNKTAYWNVDTLNPHSPKAYLFLKDTVSKNPTAFDGWFVYKCMDFKVGDTYRLSYWKKTDVGYNGKLTIAYGNVTTQPATFTTILQNNKPVTADGIWTKDSVDFTPTYPTLYLGFYGVGTTAGKGTDISFDDLKIMNTKSTTGIKDVFNDNVLFVDPYPNPSTGLVTLDMGKVTKSIVEVYNMLGECVAKKEFSEQKNILDLTHLKTGMYSMKVIANNKLAVKQLILAK